VATAAGGLPEIIDDGKTGRLVAPADAASLAQGIVELLSQQEMADAMAAAGRAKVRRHFSFEAMADKNVKVYQKTVVSEK
jgi:glycosyltransferase involved in cell wall biosynthesis